MTISKMFNSNQTNTTTTLQSLFQNQKLNE